MEQENAFSFCRSHIRRTFEKDPDFKRTYRDNVVMFLYDRVKKMPLSQRNEIADDLINLIFGLKPYDY